MVPFKIFYTAIWSKIDIVMLSIFQNVYSLYLCANSVGKCIFFCFVLQAVRIAYYNRSILKNLRPLGGYAAIANTIGIRTA